MQIQITSNASDITARLTLFRPLMQAELFDAMGRSLDDMQNYAVDFMYSNFKAPSGELENAFYQVVEDTGDTVTGSLINPSAYAWRREKGFSGMTDSLGRYFPHDPGIAYAENTLSAETMPIFGIFTDAVGQVISGMGG